MVESEASDVTTTSLPVDLLSHGASGMCFPCRGQRDTLFCCACICSWTLPPSSGSSGCNLSET
eukprot:6726963-Pyramimonas_sp.AAC.1